jgi:hypothetical protein
MNSRGVRRATAPAVIAIAALLATGCATGAGESPAASATAVDSATPRITLTYDGGIAVLDGTTLETEGDLEVDGFTRVNAAGDGRHVLVTVPEGFRVLDAGTWTEDGTSYVADPALTDLVFEADTAGHVVRHAGKTVLYADGTSDTTIFDTADLLTAQGELPETEVVPAPDAHHGVSVVLEDDTLLTTVGDGQGRTGIRVLDADREEIASSDECPGVHGEGTAQNEAVVFGCENGALLYTGGEMTKIAAPDEFGRMGNAYVSETSPIVVGDYKTDPDAEGYELTKLALIDTEAKTMRVVDLPEGVAYTFRDVARAPNGEIVLIGTDGQLHVLEETTGAVEASYPVIEPWEGPVEWQDAHPALAVHDGIAYVTEPSSNEVHAVDIATGDVLASATLAGAPVEIAVAAG